MMKEIKNKNKLIFTGKKGLKSNKKKLLRLFSAASVLTLINTIKKTHKFLSTLRKQTNKKTR